MVYDAYCISSTLSIQNFWVTQNVDEMVIINKLLGEKIVSVTFLLQNTPHSIEEHNSTVI